MKIYAPNIHLFAFQLHKTVNSDSVQANNVELWQNADQVVRNTLQQDLHLSQHLDITKEPENQRVELLKDSVYSTSRRVNCFRLREIEETREMGEMGKIGKMGKMVNK